MHGMMFGLLALLAAGIAEAALFAQEDTDLYIQATRARAERKSLVVMLELPDCTSCQRMKQAVFPHTPASFAAGFRTVRLDLERDRPVVDPTGAQTTSRWLASRYRVPGTPAFLFFAPDGRLAYRHVGALGTPRQLELLGRFVREAGYEREPFAEYLDRHAARGAFAPRSPQAAVRHPRPRARHARATRAVRPGVRSASGRRRPLHARSPRVAFRLRSRRPAATRGAVRNRRRCPGARAAEPAPPAPLRRRCRAVSVCRSPATTRPS